MRVSGWGGCYPLSISYFHRQLTIFSEGQWRQAMCWKTSRESSWGSPPNRCCLLWRCGKITSTALVGNAWSGCCSLPLFYISFTRLIMCHKLNWFSAGMNSQLTDLLIDRFLNVKMCSCSVSWHKKTENKNPKLMMPASARCISLCTIKCIYTPEIIIFYLRAVKN